MLQMDITYLLSTIRILNEISGMMVAVFGKISNKGSESDGLLNKERNESAAAVYLLEGGSLS